MSPRRLGHATIPALMLLLASAVPLAGCARQAAPPGIRIVTTIFPLYDMARSVGGDKATVFKLVPPGVEPHSFEPKPSDVVRISEADIFVYTGKFMEPWAEKVISAVSNKNVIVVDASKGTKMIPAVFRDKDEPAGGLDPHIWLDFDNARIMARNIGDALIARDPGHGAAYEKNVNDYARKLAELDASFRATFSACKTKEIIYAGHYAFGYLANRFSLKYMAAQGISPDSEPTAGDLAKLVEQIKRDKISYIFYEELVSARIGETLASETGAKLLLLNTAENAARDEIERGISFFDILNKDLENLRIGLGCQ
ncbi:MAG: zinc ABC transporter substrate-binding protein [Chloroflexi bacterium]|nr:zinc ABC transporter substrate-binding protein [Chloroflexota bacterium]